LEHVAYEIILGEGSKTNGGAQRAVAGNCRPSVARANLLNELATTCQGSGERRGARRENFRQKLRQFGKDKFESP